MRLSGSLVTWNGSRPAVHVRSGLEGPWRTTILDTNRRPLAAAAIGAESGPWIVVGEGGLVALSLGDDTWSVSTLGPGDDPPDLLAVSANERSILVGGTSGFVAQAGPSLVWSVGSLPIPESVLAINPGAGAAQVSSPPPGSPALTTSTVWRHAGGLSWQPLPRLPPEIVPIGVDGVLLWSHNGLAVLGVTDGFAPSGFETTIDAAAHLDGARGTRWQTDLRLLNPWRQWGLVRVSGTDGDDPAVLVRIPPGAEAGLDDVVGSWFGRDHWSISTAAVHGSGWRCSPPRAGAGPSARVVRSTFLPQVGSCSQTSPHGPWEVRERRLCCSGWSTVAPAPPPGPSRQVPEGPTARRSRRHRRRRST